MVKPLSHCSFGRCRHSSVTCLQVVTLHRVHALLANAVTHIDWLDIVLLKAATPARRPMSQYSTVYVRSGRREVRRRDTASDTLTQLQ